MNKKSKMTKFTARVLAFLMVFSVFGAFGVQSVFAQSISIAGPGTHVHTISVGDVPNGARLAAPTSVVTQATAVSGGNSQLTINIENEHIGRTFTESLSFVWNEGGAYFTDTVLVTIVVAQAPAQNATFHIVSPTQVVDLTPGVTTVVDIVIRNSSNHQARQIELMPRAMPNQNFDVAVHGSTSTFNLNGNTNRTIQLAITPHRDTAVETANIPFELSFRNNIDVLQFVELILPVRVDQSEDDSEDAPRIIMSNFEMPTAAVRAGEPFTITTTLQNTSSVAAHNVQLSTSAFADNFMATSPATVFVGRIPAGASHTVSFSFIPLEDIDTASYSITLNLRYDGLDRELITDAATVFVSVQAGDNAREEGRLQITAISSPTGQFLSGQQGNFAITVTNTGAGEATSIRLQSSPEAGLVPRLASMQTLQLLEPGASHTFNFAFAPTSAATSNFHNILFEVSYLDGRNTARQSFEQSSGMLVYSPERDDDNDDPASTPHIIISDFTVDPGIVMANSEFDIFLTFQNTHANLAVQNIRVTWEVMGTVSSPGGGTQSAPSAVFVPVGASNTFFIDRIGSRSTHNHHLRLFAIPDAPAMAHTIRVTFEYEDQNGGTHTISQNIGVNVRQTSRLELGDPNIPDSWSMGMPIHLNFNASNTGRSTLFNLRVRFEGDGFDTSRADEMFGHVQSGHSGSFWSNITPMEPGPQTVYMIATFEDEMAEQHEIRQSFVVDVMGGFGGDMGFGGGDRFPPDDGFGGGWDDPWGEEDSDGSWFTNPWVIAAAGVVLAGAAVVIIILVKRKNSHNDDNDDDL
ncbi:MAG: hypothetical protein FWC69_02495 [Defluviitaleaceae bacterium]|nr:hypothetical protein [Defluviitaleaceae bacterium]